MDLKCQSSLVKGEGTCHLKKRARDGLLLVETIPKGAAPSNSPRTKPWLGLKQTKLAGEQGLDTYDEKGKGG